ncbi:MAG: nucleotidyltransferase family protein [Nanoarchaeota archaeon]
MIFKTAVIIAGGKGERLGDIGEGLPKPLVKVEGKPILERIILWLKKNGVEKIVIGVAYKKEMIKDYFGNGNRLGVKIIYTEHDENGGTEDAFRTAIEKSKIDDENFYALNGDQITDLQLEGVTNKHLVSHATVTMITTNLRTNFGIVQIDDKNRIANLKEKGEVKGLLINTGIYVFNKKIKNYLVGGNIEEKAFRKLIEEKNMISFYYDGLWTSFNDKKELAVAEKAIREFSGLID